MGKNGKSQQGTTATNAAVPLTVAAAINATPNVTAPASKIRGPQDERKQPHSSSTTIAHSGAGPNQPVPPIHQSAPVPSTAVRLLSASTAAAPSLSSSAAAAASSAPITPLQYQELAEKFDSLQRMNQQWAEKFARLEDASVQQTPQPKRRRPAATDDHKTEDGDEEYEIQRRQAARTITRENENRLMGETIFQSAALTADTPDLRRAGINLKKLKARRYSQRDMALYVDHPHDTESERNLKEAAREERNRFEDERRRERAAMIAARADPTPIRTSAASQQARRERNRRFNDDDDNTEADSHAAPVARRMNDSDAATAARSSLAREPLPVENFSGDEATDDDNDDMDVVDATDDSMHSERRQLMVQSSSAGEGSAASHDKSAAHMDTQVHKVVMLFVAKKLKFEKPTVAGDATVDRFLTEFEQLIENYKSVTPGKYYRVFIQLCDALSVEERGKLRNLIRKMELDGEVNWVQFKAKLRNLYDERSSVELQNEQLINLRMGTVFKNGSTPYAAYQTEYEDLMNKLGKPLDTARVPEFINGLTFELKEAFENQKTQMVVNRALADPGSENAPEAPMTLQVVMKILTTIDRLAHAAKQRRRTLDNKPGLNNGGHSVSPSRRQPTSTEPAKYCKFHPDLINSHSTANCKLNPRNNPSPGTQFRAPFADRRRPDTIASRPSMTSQRGPPPATYTCFNCKKPGHWKSDCPTVASASSSAAPPSSGSVPWVHNPSGAPKSAVRSLYGKELRAAAALILNSIQEHDEEEDTAEHHEEDAEQQYQPPADDAGNEHDRHDDHQDNDDASD